jgi:hypothetical protein
VNCKTKKKDEFKVNQIRLAIFIFSTSQDINIQINPIDAQANVRAEDVHNKIVGEGAVGSAMIFADLSKCNVEEEKSRTKGVRLLMHIVYRPTSFK